MSAPIVLQILVDETNLLLLQGVNANLICPVVPIAGPRGPVGPSGRGLVRNVFIATEGQTEFTVDFEANDNYMALIDNAPQSHLLVVRDVNKFTCAFPLSAGQIVEIFD